MCEGEIGYNIRYVASGAGDRAMSFEVQAIYEGGVLKVEGTLPLREHERVSLTIRPEAASATLSYGLIGWTGDPESARRVALEPEFGIAKSP